MEKLCPKFISTCILIISPGGSTALEFMPSSFLEHLPNFKNNFNPLLSTFMN
jgi:hypothetical protein